jgi:predicted porin
MNKKLIAAAIGAAVVAAPAAFADATVYGKIHTDVRMNDSSVANSDNYTVNSNASRLGFKGSEDLGNGLKAIYQIEMQFNSDGGTAQVGTAGFSAQRNTFVGLSGDWGTVVVGKHDTPAKIAFYATGNEVLGDSIIDLNSGVAGVFTEVRANNAIAYVSPSFSGFSMAAAVVPGEETVAANGANAADGISDHYSVGLMYTGFGLKAGISYENLHEQVPAAGWGNGEDQEMLQIGASYTFNNFSVGAQYESDDNYQANTNRDYEAWALTAKAKFGNNAISAIYTTSETEDPGVTLSDTDGWGLAAEHNFSKRTKVYVAYATEDEDVGNSDQDSFSIGMIHDF